MKRSLVLAAALAAAVPSFAATISLSDLAGDALAVDVLPGGTFDVVVTLDANQGLTGLNYFLEASQGGILSLTNRVLAPASPFTDANLALGVVTGALDTVTPDLGSTMSDMSVNSPAGTYVLATLTLSVDAGATPGTVSLNFASNSTMNDDQFIDYSLVAGADYTVNVVAVPEPTTLGLLMVGGMLLGRRRR